MKTFDFIPSICQKEDAKWEGKITLRKFSFDEKFLYIQALDVDLDGGDSFTTNHQLDRIRRMVALSEKFYVAVDLKNKESGEEIKSFEDMSYENDLHNAMIEVAGKLMESAKVGNG